MPDVALLLLFPPLYTFVRRIIIIIAGYSKTTNDGYELETNFMKRISFFVEVEMRRKFLKKKKDINNAI